MTISILGCGWLGLPLGKTLAKKGFAIKGSTTRKEKLTELQTAGIAPYLVTLDPEVHGDTSFFHTDLLIINLPPKNHDGQPDFHEQQLLSVSQAALAGGVSRILFVSSTAVYPNLNRVVTEEDADPSCLSRGGVPLLKMEQVFTQQKALQTTILRFGGLYGPGRHPGRFLAGKRDLPGASNPVNMIHLEDCMGVITAIIDQDIWGQVFNACSPDHPTRKSFYEKAALEMGLEPPQFSDEPSAFKKVSSEKLIAFMGFQFSH